MNLLIQLERTTNKAETEPDWNYGKHTFKVRLEDALEC